MALRSIALLAQLQV